MSCPPNLPPARASAMRFAQGLACVMAGFLGFALLCGCGPAKPASAPAKQPAVGAKPSAAVPVSAEAGTNLARMPQSVFSTNGGKDPFFPRSTRLAVKAAAAAARQTTTKTPEPAVDSAQMSLQLIAGTGASRYAVVNNAILSQGKDVWVTLKNNQRVKVHCVRIARDSVLLSTGGQAPVEIKLNDR